MLKECQKRDKRKLMNFKANEKERAVIKQRALEYTNGNISEWLRYAATKLVPRKKDLMP